MLKKIGFWIDNARYTALAQSITPSLLAIAMASNAYGFSLPLSIIALLGIVFAHLGLNLADDYFDYRNGDMDRREKAKEGMRLRIAKCEYITSGKATLKQTLRVIIIFLSLALVCGVIIVCYRGLMNILWVVLLGGIVGLGYSMPKIRLSYRGFGELVIGLVFGPLLMIGMYYSASGEFSSALNLISIAIGLLVINILYAHSIMDIECDTSIGKKTLAHILKTGKRRLIASFIFSFLPFLLILIGIFTKTLHWAYAFSFLSLPMAIYFFKSIRAFVNEDKTSSLEPKWFLGKMERWDKIKAANIDWFMFRWYLARNLVTFFSLILIAVNLFL